MPAPLVPIILGAAALGTGIASKLSHKGAREEEQTKVGLYDQYESSNSWLKDLNTQTDRSMVNQKNSVSQGLGAASQLLGVASNVSGMFKGKAKANSSPVADNNAQGVMNSPSTTMAQPSNVAADPVSNPAVVGIERSLSDNVNTNKSSQVAEQAPVVQNNTSQVSPDLSFLNNNTKPWEDINFRQNVGEGIYKRPSETSYLARSINDLTKKIQSKNVENSFEATKAPSVMPNSIQKTGFESMLDSVINPKRNLMNSSIPWNDFNFKF